jgi:solute:Na+ symporter, SSS family
MNSSLLVIFGFLLFSLYLGIKAKKGKDMSLEQWAVGGRGFGAIFVFLLMAGESFTTFTLLGASSWAYGKGGPALYILAYLSLTYVLIYWMFPVIWKYAKDHNLVSQSDFFVSKYKSKYLGVLVAFIGVVSIIVSEASYGTISPTVAVWISAISVTVYVMISGIHGSAWTAVIKDIMIFAIVVFIGIYIPFHYYGGIQPMFESIHASNPEFLTVPDTGLSLSWLISTVIMTVFGAAMWPHLFVSAYSAKNAKSIRKNAIFTPLYVVMLLFVFFVGFAAIGQVPGLEGTATDLALLQVSIQTFDPWFVGVIGAAGLLTALVPGSMLLLVSSSALAKNVYKVIVPTATDRQVSTLAKSLVPVIALISVYFTLNGGNGIVTLLLMAYSFVTQLFPAVLASLMKSNFVTKQGAAVGMITGMLIVGYITLTGASISTLFPSLPQGVQELNTGIIALVVNVCATVIVSLFTRKPVMQPSIEDKTESA